MYMSVVHEIFDAFGGPTRLSEATGFPMKTVFSWKGKGVPPWRRPAVLDAARSKAVPLSAGALLYLQSSDRTPQVHAQC
jgi:hypothetical protein